MAPLPAGTITILFSDIEGSTRRWQGDEREMASALARHDRLTREAIHGEEGHVVKHTGDGVFAVFASAAAAVRAAVALQRSLAAEPWPGEPVRVRIGLHSGEAALIDDDYFGPAVNVAARVMAAGWGGQVLATSATVELSRGRVAEGIGFRSLGEHRLRDVGTPLVLWDVRHHELPAMHPPPRSLEHATGNLPSFLSPFVGRRADLAAICEDVRSARLLTLTGPGGVGKTRLAIEAAAAVHDDHPDGTWLCELAPLTDPDALPAVVAATFGVIELPGQRVAETLAEYLGPRRLLLVLDNCEHVIDAAAELAELLCRSCADLRVLLTSREPLGVPGERVRAIAPLAVDDAVSLFVDRARAVQPTFAPDAAVMEICERLDGIPLAIEMAAARVRSLQPGEIAARLHDRFRLLIGARTNVGRQQTLRATVAWSYDLLDDRERMALRRLATFVGWFGLDAAEAVASDADLDGLDLDDVLDSLVAKSLIVAGSALDATRYRMLETIRQFALEQLGLAGEETPVQERHARYYARFVAEAAVGLRGAEEPDWADRVADALDNLRVAELWAVDRRETATALALFAPLPPTGLAEPIAAEIFGWVGPAFELPDVERDPRYWDLWNWRCLRSLNLFEFDELRRHREGVRHLPGADDRPEPHFADALVHLTEPGAMAQAARAYQEASVRYAAAGDDYHAARHRAMSLFARSGLGVDDELRQEVEAFLEVARQLPSPYMRSFACGSLGCALGLVFDDPALALARCEEMRGAAAQSRNQFAARTFESARALALVLLGRSDALSQTVESFVPSRNRNQMSLQLGAFAAALSIRGDHSEAAELIGALGPGNTIEVYRSVQPIVEAWTATREALGDEAYAAALARGARRSNEELVAWFSETVRRLLADHG